MLVVDIIAETVWLPGATWLECAQNKAPPPEISILLPTFCRFADGYFERAVASVLNQSLRNIELIIIDDASVDGTRDRIAQFMRDDPRISCLRHPRNVGLPAISEYEAYVKSRGKYIAFAFDDDEFLPESLERLLAHALALEADIIHGHVDIFASNIVTGEPFSLSQFGAAPTPQTHLVSHNFIANTSVMVSRSLIETIGFYDPNIAVTRNCDWDLWLRAAAQYRVHRMDVAMGKVSGPSRKESLGRTYGLEAYLSHEWTQLDRNQQLRPANFLNIDVQEIPESLCISSKMALIELHQNFRKKFWYQPRAIEIHSRCHADEFTGNSKNVPDGYVLIVVASFDASVILHFEHLQTKFRQRLRIIHAPTFQSVISEEMVGASAIVFVRLLFPHADWIENAKQLGIPHYYFLDDNFLELAKTPEFSEYLAAYTVSNVKKTLGSFSGVLLSTTALVDYFSAHSIHANLDLFPPIVKRPVLAASPEESVLARSAQPFTVLFFGGSHRIDAFKELVVPALLKLSEQIPTRLISVGADFADLSKRHARLTLVSLPADHSYDIVLRELMQYRVDVLAHPGVDNLNNEFKNLNVLINAYCLGAVPVLSKIKPYVQLPSDEYNYFAENASEWHTQLLRVLHGAVDAENDVKRSANASLLARLGTFIEKEYNGAKNEFVLQKMLNNESYAGLLNRDQRLRLAIFYAKCKTEEVESELSAARRLLAQVDINSNQAGVNALAPESSQIKVADKQIIATYISKGGALIGRMFATFGYTKLARGFTQRFTSESQYRSLPAAWTPLFHEADGLASRQLGLNPLFPSTDLSVGAFHDFLLPKALSTLTAIEFPIEVGVRAQGVIGIELVDGSNVIVLNQTQALPASANQVIVRFQFEPLDLVNRGEWRIRVFTRETLGQVKVPVYRVGGILEPGWVLLANYR